jgi:hypothetical protein
VDYFDLVVLQILVVKIVLGVLVHFVKGRYFVPNNWLDLHGLCLSPLALLLEILSEHFLKLLAGLALELVVLLDVFLDGPQIFEMGGQAELLNEGSGTRRAASRCSTLIVFFFWFSQITFDLSDRRDTNSGLGSAYTWPGTVVWRGIRC